MTSYRIPFNKPTLVGNELRYVAEAVESGHLAGDGTFTERCSELLETSLGVHKALLTPSCTHALEMCALLLDIQPGDEVVVPSFAFVTTVNAFVMRGARPVFVDVRADTLNLDEGQLRDRITPKTRAIVVLHYAGGGCEMDEIMRISRETAVPVVEDNAHGLFGTYKGRFLGTFGCLATQSFHETKNFTCGEGGALLISGPEWVERAGILRDRGTNRRSFLRGEVDRYTWVDYGSSYLPSEIQAAFLYAQLRARKAVQARRGRMWHTYRDELRDWSARQRVALPCVPESCSPPHHIFYLLLPSAPARSSLIAHLEDRGIASAFHFQPLHLSEMGQRFGGRPGDCPVTEDVSERLLRLPLYDSLSPREQAEVIQAVCDFGSA